MSSADTPRSVAPADRAADRPTAATVDVAVVGYGPVGRLLALLLGRAGHRVVVLERQSQHYPLPRAVHFDDEIGRIFQSLGLPPDELDDAVTPYDDFYEWRAADGRVLLRLDWRGRGPAGWHVSHFFHQPALEARLRAAVESLETVELRTGRTVVAHVERDSEVELAVEGPDGEQETLRARWVIGADGANSTVRDWLGTTTTDLGYFHDWLVVDLLTEVRDRDRPPAWQLCDPARPTTLVPGGPGRRRFEFMRLPEEDREELVRPERVWQLLAPWGVTADNAVLQRHVLYTFQARWCDRWRRGRLLIAGDAAHLMPPFAGQGMCSGLRDAANLAWKLDLVLRSRAPHDLLDTYGSERAEHVQHFIAASMDLGGVICLTDPAAAAARDDEMITQLATGRPPAPRPLPRLGPGLHRGDEDPGGGTLAVQGPVRLPDGRAGMLDDAFPPGRGYLLLAEPGLAALLDDGRRELLAEFDIGAIALGAEPAEDVVVDVEGTHGAWLRELGACAALVRPDRYVFGTAATPQELSALVQEFGEAVGGHLVSAGTGERS